MGRLDDTSMTRVDEALQISFGLGMDKEVDAQRRAT